MTTLGFSPCPNDTFIFYAIANKKIDLSGFDFELTVEDVETLNSLALRRELDVSKVSCHAYYHLRNDYVFLKAGAALGRGCGPLIVTKKDMALADLKDSKIAVPGRYTTAALLLKLCLSENFGAGAGNFIIMPFNLIMAAVSRGEVDAGLIIHEGRFTYPEYGLRQLADLGVWWEKKTGLPIPLGGIAAKKTLGSAAVAAIENLIRASVNYSFLHKEEAMPYIKQNAQELSEKVIMEHIGLYVNPYTITIAHEGEAALEMLLKMTSECGGI
ncbi:MAG: 1,4-dihydroxy-6-naphthoate synthase [Nitrospirae bacterium]|nr:MAG: 1,4-dihydroxy-6-naphthoate synthase [Nitrospirota bacterium]